MAPFACFDLDQTLLPFDTQALFCNFVVKRQPWRVVLHVIFVPFALFRACGLVSTATARRALHAYLWGMPAGTLQALAREFARTSVARWTYPEIRDEILRHANEGRVLVLNTASPDFYAREIAVELGFDYCVATRFIIGARVPLMPALPDAENSHGSKLAAMIRDVPGVSGLSEDERAQSWCYADSDGDLPLLEFAGHAICVHPTARLAAIASERNWRRLAPLRPYRNRWGYARSALLQVFGLHAG